MPWSSRSICMPALPPEGMSPKYFARNSLVSIGLVTVRLRWLSVMVVLSIIGHRTLRRRL